MKVVSRLLSSILKAITGCDTVPYEKKFKQSKEELKVGDKVIYVGKKHRESIGNQVMEVVKIESSRLSHQFVLAL